MLAVEDWGPMFPQKPIDAVAYPIRMESPTFLKLIQ
jgi:hypothetical protein